MEQFFEKFIDSITELGTTFGVKLIGGVLVLFLGIKISKLLIRLITKIKGFQHIEPSVQSFIKSLMKILLYALVFSSAAIIWGIPATSFMTIFASAGVAIGLALQGALSNFVGGLMILFFRPFNVGDYIECGSHSGVVKDITVIYTVLTTPDNKQITLPNGSLTNSNVINYSAEPLRRIDLTISADYQNDVEKVKHILLSLAQAHPDILQEPEPVARLSSHSNNSLDYAFRVWCLNENYWNVRFDLMEQIKKAFDDNNISIPFPQLDVHMKEKKD